MAIEWPKHYCGGVVRFPSLTLTAGPHPMPIAQARKFLFD